MKALRALALLAGLALATSAQAATVTIDFDSAPTTAGIDRSVSSGGLTFTDVVSSGTNFMWVRNIPAAPPFYGNGTNALSYTGQASEYITITKTGGGLFDLLSLDIGLSVRVSGNANTTRSVLIGGVSYTITRSLQTLTLNLRGISSLTISGFGNGFWVADNFVADLQPTPVSAVPLPAGLPLMMAALGGLGLLARRRRKV